MEGLNNTIGGNADFMIADEKRLQRRNGLFEALCVLSRTGREHLPHCAGIVALEGENVGHRLVAQD